MFYPSLGAKMKANDYANLYLKTYEDQLHMAEGREQSDKDAAAVDSIIIVCQKMILEIKDIGVQRKAHCASAWDAIIREQNQKWRAVVRRLQQHRDSLPLIPSPHAFQKVWDVFKEDITQ